MASIAKKARSKGKKKSAKSSSLPATAQNGPSGPTLLNTFSQPAQLQSASPLLNFPAELRLKTLRYLMKAGAPIPWFANTSTTLNFIGGGSSDSSHYEYQSSRARWRVAKAKLYHFSAQVLACCQQLYREGVYIVYKENQAKILCTWWGIEFLNMNIWASWVFGALSTSAHPGYSDPLLMEIATMHGCMRHRYLDRRAYVKETTTSRETYQVYSVIAAFDELIVDVVAETRDQFFECLQAVQYLLKDKQAILNIRQGSRVNAPPAPNTWLNSCRLLRQKGDIM